jgi:hypothetical protein
VNILISQYFGQWSAMRFKLCNDLLVRPVYSERNLKKIHFIACTVFWIGNILPSYPNIRSPRNTVQEILDLILIFGHR